MGEIRLRLDIWFLDIGIKTSQAIRLFLDCVVLRERTDLTLTAIWIGWLKSIEFRRSVHVIERRSSVVEGKETS